jgi:predicted transcriptional regulator of viral defense system
VREGTVERLARGLYTVADHQYTEKHSLTYVAKRVPAATVSLLTALRFHDLTTQSPWNVWITLSTKARTPSLDYPRICVLRSSGAALVEGIEVHRVEGVDLRAYSAAKTVVDCFKYRNKVGIDVAVEALQDFTRRYRDMGSELDRFAKVCRVTRVMRPYLEAMI